MKLFLLVALVVFESSCGGTIAGESAANDSEMLSWTTGHCRHAPSTSLSTEDTCIRDLTREVADLYTVYSDCKMTHTSPGRPSIRDTKNLAPETCSSLKAELTGDLVAAVDDPNVCVDATPGREAFEFYDARGTYHHKELIWKCPAPPLAAFREFLYTQCFRGAWNSSGQ